MQTNPHKDLSLPILGIFSITAYVLLAYFTVRTDVIRVFELFAILFIAYGLAYKMINSTSDYLLAMGAAVLFRFLLLFSLPNLSDDFYRFVWDGRLFANGISPFAYLPIHFLDGTYTGTPIAGIDTTLLDSMNSPKYYTIYPPVCQAVFWLAAKLFPTDLQGAVVVMKSCIFLFEVGSLYLLHRLALHFKVAEKTVLLYALNPLVIAELTGNLHFEAAMVFFVLLAVWGLVQLEKIIQNNSVATVLPLAPSKGGIRMASPFGGGLRGRKQHILTLPSIIHRRNHGLKWFIFSALAFSLAINSKLLPLMFLPFFIKRMGWGFSMAFFSLTGFFTLIAYVPLFNIEILQNLLSSVGLYINSFEFNASIYYVLRSVGYLLVGFNLIHILGKMLALFTFTAIVYMAWTERILSSLSLKLFLKKILLALFLYFALANIVHPWYVCGLVAFCVFTPYRFPIVWSALVVLSYYTYLTDQYIENLWLVGLEYGVVYGYFLWEVRLVKHTNSN